MRWDGLLFSGDGKGRTLIEGGIYENEYKREGGAWKISVSRYFPQYDGDYDKGWRNTDNADLGIAPYHFTLDETGVPLPPAATAAPKSKASLAELEARVAQFNDEDAVANLQHAYGYYVDRRMWDDVVDLFAKDGTVVIEGVGAFKGADGVRRAMERMGPAGHHRRRLQRPPDLRRDRPHPAERYRSAEPWPRARPGGRCGEAHAALGVHGVPQSLREGRRHLEIPRAAPVSGDDRAIRGRMGQGRRCGVRQAGHGADARRPLRYRRPSRSSSGSEAERLAAARTAYTRSTAREGTENVSAAYGFYIDDFQWPEMAGIFSEKGNKHSPFAGYYIGRDRILGAVNANYGATTTGTKRIRSNIAYHWRTQPVIFVSADGRSANMRARLIQTATAKSVEGQPNRSSFSSGMYPNDQSVIENGIWRLWSLEIDEHYMTSDGWKGGWSGVKPVGKDRPPSPPSRLLSKYPPDILMTELGKRAEHLRGGTGEPVEWPGILPMWFNYKNPVSGREPPLYLHDCVPCEMRPQSRMTNHGYQLPPTGAN